MTPYGNFIICKCKSSLCHLHNFSLITFTSLVVIPRSSSWPCLLLSSPSACSLFYCTAKKVRTSLPFCLNFIDFLLSFDLNLFLPFAKLLPFNYFTILNYLCSSISVSKSVFLRFNIFQTLTILFPFLSRG